MGEESCSQPNGPTTGSYYGVLPLGRSPLETAGTTLAIGGVKNGENVIRLGPPFNRQTQKVARGGDDSPASEQRDVIKGIFSVGPGRMGRACLAGEGASGSRRASGRPGPSNAAGRGPPKGATEEDGAS